MRRRKWMVEKWFFCSFVFKKVMLSLSCKDTTFLGKMQEFLVFFIPPILPYLDYFH